MYECMEPKQYACLEGSELSPIYMLDRVPEPGDVFPYKPRPNSKIAPPHSFFISSFPLFENRVPRSALGT